MVCFFCKRNIQHKKEQIKLQLRTNISDAERRPLLNLHNENTESKQIKFFKNYFCI